MRNIQKVLSYIFVAFLVTLFVGCGSKDISVSEKLSSKNFKLEKIDFIFEETKKIEDIAYHTKEELEKMLNENIKAKLYEKGWLSNDISLYTLKVEVNYKRRYIWDGMPFFTLSNSLMYPNFSYKIHVFDNSGKKIRSFTSDELTLRGNLDIDKKIFFGDLKDKKYEIWFIKAIAQGIIEKIDTF